MSSENPKQPFDNAPDPLEVKRDELLERMLTLQQHPYAQFLEIKSSLQNIAKHLQFMTTREDLEEAEQQVVAAEAIFNERD